MKFSYNWLKEYVSIKETPAQLADVLTMHSFEAEGIEKMDKGLENIVVGKIIEAKKHPNADRLMVITVNVGKEVLQIVCGDTKVTAGQKVAVALVGAELVNGMKIEEREVRGVKSRGMICAEDELGLGVNHAGVLILPEETEIGMPFAKFLNLEDTLIDLNILPDRAHDALSYWGMSQEIAAVLGRKMNQGIYDDAKFNFTENNKDNIKKIIEADIQNEDLCRRFSARVVKNVLVGSSPVWIQDKLKRSGIRPINNLVDISNLAMLEVGHPLHIFDMDKIESVKARSDSALSVKKIIVRNAKKGEKILALDGKEYALNENNLVIADIKKPLDVAGIMGGEHASVSSKTKNILITAANFDPVSIRKTSKALGLASDASYRFERDIDRNLNVLVLNRAVELIQQISGGEVSKGMLDVYHKRTRPAKIKLELSAVEKLLGIKISKENIIKILNNLGLKVKKGKKDSLEIIAPTRRVDITGPIEVIREIGRIYGYHKIVPTRPKIELSLPEMNFNADYRNKIKNLLVANGFTEVYNYSFIGEKELSNIGTDNKHYLELANPLSSEHKYLRLSLIPSILNNISENSLTLADENIKIFELGKVYYKKYMGSNNCLLDGAVQPGDAGAGEKFMLAGAVYDKNSKELFYRTKEAVELLLNFLGIKDAVYSPITEQCEHMPVWHMGRTAFLSVGENIIGIMGEVDQKTRENFKIEGRVGLFNLDFKKIVNIASEKKIAYNRFSKFPSVKLDLAVLTPKKIAWSQIKEIVFQAGGGLVKNIELFDIYEGKNIITDNLIGKRSLAFHISLQSQEKTLKDEDVKTATDKIIDELKNKLGVSLRR